MGYATEKEIDEAREKLLKVIGYDNDFDIAFELMRHVYNDSEVKYIKQWRSSCRLPVNGECECCGETKLKFFTTSIIEHKTPLEAVNDLIENIKSGDYV